MNSIKMKLWVVFLIAQATLGNVAIAQAQNEPHAHPSNQRGFAGTMAEMREVMDWWKAHQNSPDPRIVAFKTAHKFSQFEPTPPTPGQLPDPSEMEKMKTFLVELKQLKSILESKTTAQPPKKGETLASAPKGTQNSSVVKTENKEVKDKDCKHCGPTDPSNELSNGISALKTQVAEIERKLDRPILNGVPPGDFGMPTQELSRSEKERLKTRIIRLKIRQAETIACSKVIDLDSDMEVFSGPNEGRDHSKLRKPPIGGKRPKGDFEMNDPARSGNMKLSIRSDLEQMLNDPFMLAEIDEAYQDALEERIALCEEKQEERSEKLASLRPAGNEMTLGMGMMGGSSQFGGMGGMQMMGGSSQFGNMGRMQMMGFNGGNMFGMSSVMNPFSGYPSSVYNPYLIGGSSSPYSYGYGAGMFGGGFGMTGRMFGY